MQEYNQGVSIDSSSRDGVFEATAGDALRYTSISGEPCEENNIFTTPLCEKNGVLHPSLLEKLLVRLSELAPKIGYLEQAADR